MGALAALLLLPLATLALAAQSTDRGSVSHTPNAPSTTADSVSKLPKISIEAARERALQLKLEKFVHKSVVIPHWDGTLFAGWFRSAPWLRAAEVNG